MNKSIKIILGVLGGLAVLFIISAAIFIASLLSMINKQKNADFYKMGEDRIVSMKAVVGLRELNGISSSIKNGTVTKTYEYKSGTCANDVEQYIDYLIVKEGFIQTILSPNDHNIVYKKDSVEEGKILILSITVNGFGYTITIQKGEGIISPLEV